MKRISYAVNRNLNGPRKSRKRNAKVPTLDITSLVDILTILLVFLIKNVSMEAQKVSIPSKMNMPATMNDEKTLQDKMSVILIRMYPEKVLYGLSGRLVGTPAQIENDQEVKRSFLNQLQSDLLKITETERTKPADQQHLPAILLQADKTMPCEYITALLAIASTDAGFSNIFFSTIKTDNPNDIFK
jgi:biopolymer transport protein ExbD